MLVKAQIIYWRDIPAQVKIRAGRQRLSRPLSQRFQDAIDEAAMRAGKTASDAYLEEWRSGVWQEQEGDAADVATRLVTELENQYPKRRMLQLVQQKGWEMPR